MVGGLTLTVVPVTAFQQNCSLLVCEETRRAAWVDPGGDLDRLARVAAEADCAIEKILLTHGHIDHCGEAGRLAEQLGVPIEGPHLDDRFWIQQLAVQGQMFGFPMAQPFEPSRWLVHGDVVTVGRQTLQVLHCPGHTPGHVVFFHDPSRLAWVGDVLFVGSIGRTDFPRGNHADLISSIRTRLFPLGDDVSFVPGHGPMGLLGEEKRSNPYVGQTANT